MTPLAEYLAQAALMALAFAAIGAVSRMLWEERKER